VPKGSACPFRSALKVLAGRRDSTPDRGFHEESTYRRFEKQEIGARIKEAPQGRRAPQWQLAEFDRCHAAGDPHVRAGRSPRAQASAGARADRKHHGRVGSSPDGTGRTDLRTWPACRARSMSSPSGSGSTRRRTRGSRLRPRGDQRRHRRRPEGREGGPRQAEHGGDRAAAAGLLARVETGLSAALEIHYAVYRAIVDQGVSKLKSSTLHDQGKEIIEEDAERTDKPKGSAPCMSGPTASSQSVGTSSGSIHRSSSRRHPRRQGASEGVRGEPEPPPREARSRGSRRGRRLGGASPAERPLLRRAEGDANLFHSCSHLTLGLCGAILPVAGSGRLRRQVPDRARSKVIAETSRWAPVLMVSLILSSLLLSVGLGALLIAGFLNLVTRLFAK